jgi:hypothetical protein
MRIAPRPSYLEIIFLSDKINLKTATAAVLFMFLVSEIIQAVAGVLGVEPHGVLAKEKYWPQNTSHSGAPERFCLLLAAKVMKREGLMLFEAKN